MGRRPFFSSATLILFWAFSLPCFTTGSGPIPYVSSALSERLKGLPFGLSRKNVQGLTLEEVDSVKFFGAANGASQFGAGSWMTDEGLWLELKNLGPDNWA